MSDNQSRFRISEERRRVLLIEDDYINQEMLRETLAETYDLMIAASGEEAMAVLEEHYETLSVLLLDLNLPGILGVDVLRQLRNDPRYTNLPVIVMTSDSEAEAECLTLGAVDFIPKPYPPSKVILARIRRTIELSEDRDILRWTERDHLTGLYNKEFFYRYAVQLDLYHKDTPTDAIVVDINHFHMVNDRYGKAYGDEVLKKIAEKSLSEISEGGGIVCRCEPDMFMFYCPHRTDYVELLDRLSVVLKDSESGENRIRLRMGVYPEADKSLDIERRFDRAKMAADSVKGNLVQPIGFFDYSMRESEVLAEQLIEDFSTAIKEKQFIVFFQPKFDVREPTPALISAEALVRWRHPKLGMVSPGVFIPLFETNGLIQELDRYVWTRTAEQIRDWKERLNITMPVSVNVSRIDLYDPELVERLLEIVRSNNLSVDELILEITESAYTENSEKMVEKVKQLRSLGFKIEMDDFGSGYSSLSMLSSLPIDALKLDMHFIRNAFKDRKDTRLLEAMIRLSASFEVPTIAEGVETAEQLFTLKTMGCDVIQGFYFSPPLPPDEFEIFMGENEERPFVKTEHKRRTRTDRFTYKALHDSVTGLYNYSAFDILFHDADLEHVAVLIAKISGLAELTERMGRDYADNELRRVANVLKSHFRSVDHICRLSEDEFVVIVTRLTSAGKDLVLSKIESMSAALKSDDDELEPLKLCVGIAFSDRARPEGDVFQDADTALNRLLETNDAGYAVY
jgi:diguanylate cyclase (GGDEF)-like protein